VQMKAESMTAKIADEAKPMLFKFSEKKELA
jgi:hypothetical protein